MHYCIHFIPTIFLSFTTMSSFAESLNNREKMLLCQFINEHNFNYTSVARSLSNHSLLVDKPAGYFTAEVGRAYT